MYTVNCPWHVFHIVYVGSFWVEHLKEKKTCFILFQGWKRCIFWICGNIRYFPCTPKDTKFWSWRVWGHPLTGPYGVQERSFHCLGTFQTQIVLLRHFRFLLLKFFQCFSMTTSMHAKVYHFFLSEWHSIRGILRIPGRFSCVTCGKNICLPLLNISIFTLKHFSPV